MQGEHRGSSSRGVSTVIGFLLVVAIVVGGTTVVLTLGQDQLAATQEQYATERAAKVMANFDSDAGLVALGGASTQEVEFGPGGDITVREEAGRMTITLINETGNRTEIANATLGAVENEIGATDLAYQGGGIWRQDRGATRMVSPPEFHYRGRTLTFPVITVEGDYSGAGSSVYVESNGTSKVYPNETLRNPVSSGTIRVEVTSRYHDGWAEYFETRTEGTVEHIPSENTAAVNLTTPIESVFDSSVITTESGPNALDPSACLTGSPGPGNSGFECPTTTGANVPSATPLVEDEIGECESGGCQDLSAEVGDGHLENGTYYHDGDFTFGPGTTTLDTSSGNIAVVVDGSVTFKGTGGPGNGDVEIVGDGSVTFYVKGNLEATGNPNINTGGDPGQLLTLLHSDAGDHAFAGGTPQYTGVIYAPNADFEIDGGGAVSSNVLGSVVARTADAGGNGYVDYAESLDLEMQLRFDPELTYLHVTRNRVVVTGE